MIYKQKQCAKDTLHIQQLRLTLVFIVATWGQWMLRMRSI